MWVGTALTLFGCASTSNTWPAPEEPTANASPAGVPATAEQTADDDPLRSSIPGLQRGTASYYSNHLAGRKTANGERYDPNQMTAAHRTLPFGTWVEVRRAADGRRVVVRINDRGPFAKDRIIDLSRKAASQLGMLHSGRAEVEIRMLAQTANTSSFR